MRRPRRTNSGSPPETLHPSSVLRDKPKKSAASDAGTNSFSCLIAARERTAEALLRPISASEAALVAQQLREKLLSAPAAQARRYARAVISRVVVLRESIEIRGPNSEIAELACAPDREPTSVRAVRSSDRKWYSCVTTINSAPARQGAGAALSAATPLSQA